MRRRHARERPQDPKEPKKNKIQRLKEVLPLAWTLVRPRLPALGLGLLLILISRSAGLVLPATARVFIDDVVTGAKPEKMRFVFVAVFAAALVQAACSYLLFRVLTVRTIELVADLRTRGIAHLIRLAVPFFDKNRTGALLPRVLHDIEALRLLIGSGFIDFAGGVFFAALSAVYMWTISPRLTLVALTGLLAFLALLGWAFWGIAGSYGDRAKLLAETSGRLSEVLSGIRVIKAYRAEERESTAMAASVAAMRDNAIEMATNNRVFSFWSTTLVGALGLGLMSMALSEIREGRLTLGGLTTFSLLLGFVNGPVYMVVALAGQFADALVSIERLQGILNEPGEAVTPAGAPSTSPLRAAEVKGHVAFENVTFEYRPGEPVLRNVTLVAPPGTATALVGPSGAGKSTIMGLLAAFYRPQSGRILLDGHDITTLPLSDYRAHLGVVFQDTFLFDATLRENVLFARPEATQAEFEQACLSAHVEEFASRFNDGYDTIVGERGVMLSGGQKQRVAIARAFLANPRILLLDEATSNLDSESEALIQKGLESLLPGRTTFVIAHRLSTVRSCQQILVLDHGEVIERGTYADLLRLGGRYASMLEQQTATPTPL
ncbi:MAG: ABC transporter ATP-binding protein/permease [Vicinamibacteria bacterium]|nr:ABC transporter ATP-binding protein/permease [Vicinamibacteria bacterium]